MVTRLTVSQADIEPARVISADEYLTQNYSLHICMEELSLGLFYVLKWNSGNLVSDVIPRDVREFWAQWSVFKQELALSKEDVDRPTPVIETDWKILLPKYEEIKKIGNRKAEKVADELFNLARIIMQADSGRGKNYVIPREMVGIDEAVGIAENRIKRYIGTGAKGASGYDTGLVIPALPEIGRTEPDIDYDYVTQKEPSADSPEGPFPTKLQSTK